MPRPLTTAIFDFLERILLRAAQAIEWHTLPALMNGLAHCEGGKSGNFLGGRRQLPQLIEKLP